MDSAKKEKHNRSEQNRNEQSDWKKYSCRLWLWRWFAWITLKDKIFSNPPVETKNAIQTLHPAFKANKRCQQWENWPNNSSKGRREAPFWLLRIYWQRKWPLLHFEAREKIYLLFFFSVSIFFQVSFFVVVYLWNVSDLPVKSWNKGMAQRPFRPASLTASPKSVTWQGIPK